MSRSCILVAFLFIFPLAGRFASAQEEPEKDAPAKGSRALHLNFGWPTDKPFRVIEMQKTPWGRKTTESTFLLRKSDGPGRFILTLEDLKILEVEPSGVTEIERHRNIAGLTALGLAIPAATLDKHGQVVGFAALDAKFIDRVMDSTSDLVGKDEDFRNELREIMQSPAFAASAQSTIATMMENCVLNWRRAENLEPGYSSYFRTPPSKKTGGFVAGESKYTHRGSAGSEGRVRLTLDLIMRSKDGKGYTADAVNSLLADRPEAKSKITLATVNLHFETVMRPATMQPDWMTTRSRVVIVFSDGTPPKKVAMDGRVDFKW